MNWSSVLVGVVVGVAVGFLASYPVGYLRELGRERAARCVKARDRRSARRLAEAKERAEDRDREVEGRHDAEEVERLKSERIGAVFLHRLTRSDLGLRTTVERLGEPVRRNVIVRYEPMPDRVATSQDPPPTLSMEWRILTESVEEQRRRTARIVGSDDAADGWIQYEPMRSSLGR